MYYAVHQAPYANYEALERRYQSLVVDRLSDPATREQEREWGRKRVEQAKAHLAALEGAAREVRP